MADTTELTEFEERSQPYLKDKEISFPGRMIYTTNSGDPMIGCRVQWFNSDYELNKFFEDHRHEGLNAVGMYPTADKSILLVYTCQLSQDDRDYLDTRAEVVEAETKRRWAEKQAIKEANAKARREQEAELKRLADIGLKCEQNHRKDKAEKK